MKILVTGGAGYIGSHTCVELVVNGYKVVVIDNYSNSSADVINKVEKITHSNIKVYQADIRNRIILQKIFSENHVDAIIHFAGLKAVGESVKKPLKYYDNNVGGSIILLEEAQRANCPFIIFSSSATVYGNPEKLPISEDATTGNITNPYGMSKLMVENILRDIYSSNNKWKIGLLRYFNPVGAHSSGLIGESPKNIPNNLMPFISQVASGKLNTLKVFGGDYPTSDGTGIRDYIHVVDLAKGHVKALEYFFLKSNGEVLTVNLGTGRGYSVMEMINTFESVSGKAIPYEIVARRDGDIATCFADVSFAKERLNWEANLDIMEMCKDTWHFQNNIKK